MKIVEHPPAAEHWQHKIARKFTAKANKNIVKTLKYIEKHCTTYIPAYSIAIGIVCNIENETRRKTKLSVVQLCSELFSWDFVAFGEGLQSADFSHKNKEREYQLQQKYKIKVVFYYRPMELTLFSKT